MSNINIQKKFPVAYCINLDREPEKYENILKKFSDILEIKKIHAIDGKLNNISGRQALYMTNVNFFIDIVNSDKIKKPYFIIIEDDIYKFNNFDYYWPKILKFINNINNKWDFISLDFFLNLEKPKLEIYNDIFYKIHKSRTCGFMIYNTKFIKNNIEYLKNCGCLDMTMKHNPKFIQLIPKDLIIKQIVNKMSGTGNRVTSDLENCYLKTIEYLKI
jgi:GR25 family glycosyltransferase involved in LPS biosynthesis